MFKRNTLGLGGAALCGALLVSGCANQMSQRSEHEERVERKLLDHSLQIDVGEPKVLELPQRRVKINEQKTFEVTEFEVTRRYDATRLTSPGAKSMRFRWAQWRWLPVSAPMWSMCSLWAICRTA